MKVAHTKEREKRKIWVENGSPRGMLHKAYADYKRAKREFRNIQAIENERYVQETYDDLNTAAECDLRLFWKDMKRQKPKKEKPCVEITFNDSVHQTPESVCDAFAEYYYELYTVSNQ